LCTKLVSTQAVSKDDMEFWVRLCVRNMGNITNAEVFQATKEAFVTVLDYVEQPSAADHFGTYLVDGRGGQYGRGCTKPGVPITNNHCETMNKDLKKALNYESYAAAACVQALLTHASTRSKAAHAFDTTIEVPDVVWDKAQTLVDMGWHEVHYRSADGSGDIFVSWEELQFHIDDQLEQQHGYAIRYTQQQRRPLIWQRVQKFKSLLSNPARICKAILKLDEGPGDTTVMERFKALIKLCLNTCYVLTPLQPSQQVSQYVKYQCTCVAYWKEMCCKHSVAWGVASGDFDIPLKFSKDQIKRRRLGGRPPKATGGW
jgi:hypothetical protein